jgi:hypothetical protein
MADFFGVLAGRWRSFIELLARPEIFPSGPALFIPWRAPV